MIKTQSTVQCASSDKGGSSAYLLRAVGTGPWLEGGVRRHGEARTDGVGRGAVVVVVAVRDGRLVGAGAGYEGALVLVLLLAARDAEGRRCLLVALQRLAQHGRDVVHIGRCDRVTSKTRHQRGNRE